MIFVATFRRVSLPLGEVSVSTAMAEDNVTKGTTPTERKQPPPIAAFFSAGINKPHSSKKVRILGHIQFRFCCSTLINFN